MEVTLSQRIRDILSDPGSREQLAIAIAQSSKARAIKPAIIQHAGKSYTIHYGHEPMAKTVPINKPVYYVDERGLITRCVIISETEKVIKFAEVINPVTDAYSGLGKEQHLIRYSSGIIGAFFQSQEDAEAHAAEVHATRNRGIGGCLLIIAFAIAVLCLPWIDMVLRAFIKS